MVTLFVGAGLNHTRRLTSVGGHQPRSFSARICFLERLHQGLLVPAIEEAMLAAPDLVGDEGREEIKRGRLDAGLVDRGDYLLRNRCR